MKRFKLSLHKPTQSIYLIVLFINIFFWIISELIFDGSSNILIAMGANYAPYVKKGEAWRLLFSVFLHSGISHLIFNSIALLAFGNLIEQLFGKRNFLIIYLCSGITGSSFSVALNDNAISVGSSGAVFGLLGSLMIYYLYIRKFNPIYAKNNLIGIIILLVINLFYGLTYPRVDNWAHLGGLLGGVFSSSILLYFNIRNNINLIISIISFIIWGCMIFLLINT